MRRWVKPLAFFIALILLSFMSHRYRCGSALMDALPRLRDLTASRPVEAALLYVAATTAGCVLLALPGAAFAALAGLLFDPLAGTLLCLAAATLGAALAFLAGRCGSRQCGAPRAVFPFGRDFGYNCDGDGDDFKKTICKMRRLLMMKKLLAVLFLALASEVAECEPRPLDLRFSCRRRESV